MEGQKCRQTMSNEIVTDRLLAAEATKKHHINCIKEDTCSDERSGRHTRVNDSSIICAMCGLIGDFSQIVAFISTNSMSDVETVIPVSKGWLHAWLRACKQIEGVMEHRERNRGCPR